MSKTGLLFAPSEQTALTKGSFHSKFRSAIAEHSSMPARRPHDSQGPVPPPAVASSDGSQQNPLGCVLVGGYFDACARRIMSSIDRPEQRNIFLITFNGEEHMPIGGIGVPLAIKPFDHPNHLPEIIGRGAWACDRARSGQAAANTSRNHCGRSA